MRRSEIEFNHRTIRAPFDGVIAKLYKHEGEYVSPIRPEVVQLVQINSLLAVFAVPTSDLHSLKSGAEVAVNFDNGSSIVGTVHCISVLTDAQSDTVQIKVLINNDLGNYRSGQRCFLRL